MPIQSNRRFSVGRRSRSRSQTVVQVGIDGVQISGVVAVHIVPPVADEILLIEQRAVGTEEGVGAPVHLADVKDLQRDASQRGIKWTINGTWHNLLGIGLHRRHNILETFVRRSRNPSRAGS